MKQKRLEKVANKPWKDGALYDLLVKELGVFTSPCVCAPTIDDDVAQYDELVLFWEVRTGEMWKLHFFEWKVVYWKGGKDVFVFRIRLNDLIVEIQV